MRVVGLTCAMVVAGGVCQAGEPTPGAVCQYGSKALSPDAHRTQGSNSPCESSEGMGPSDQDYGGDPNNHSGQAKVIEILTAPYVKPGCERGREVLVLIRMSNAPSVLEGYEIDPYCFSVFPRFLNCP